MPEDSTNIQVQRDTWKELMMRKEPGDTFDDVIQELLQIAEEHEENENGNG
jgi:predicted CopG family antitoxin